MRPKRSDGRRMPRGQVARPPWWVTRPGREQLGGHGELDEGEHRATALDGRLELLGGEVEEVHRRVDAVAAQGPLRHEQVEHVEADAGTGPFESGVGREATDDVGLARCGIRQPDGRRARRVPAHPGEVGVGPHDEDEVLRLEAGVHEGRHEQVVVAQPHVDQWCHHESVSPADRCVPGPGERPILSAQRAQDPGREQQPDRRDGRCEPRAAATAAPPVDRRRRPGEGHDDGPRETSHSRGGHRSGLWPRANHVVERHEHGVAERLGDRHADDAVDRVRATARASTRTASGHEAAHARRPVRSASSTASDEPW